MKEHDEAGKLKALADAAVFYSVARNLPKVHEVGEERYKPVLDIIEALDPNDFHGPQLMESITKAHNQISEKYGQRGVTSLTTKFLWLKMKSPIIIYDGRARTALGMKSGDIRVYPTYHAKWLRQFESFYDKIDVACTSLPRVHEYSAPNAPSSQDVQEIASQHWFKQRVFDVYLWTVGS